MPYLVATSYTVFLAVLVKIQSNSIYVNAVVLSEHHHNNKGFPLKWPHNKINKTWGKRKAMSSLQLYITKDTVKSIFPHCLECYLQIM